MMKEPDGTVAGTMLFKVNLFAVAFPSNAPAVALETGLEPASAVTSVQPVLIEPGFKSVSLVALTLYQTVTVCAAFEPPFRHSSSV